MKLAVAILCVLTASPLCHGHSSANYPFPRMYANYRTAPTDATACLNTGQNLVGPACDGGSTGYVCGKDALSIYNKICRPKTWESSVCPFTYDYAKENSVKQDEFPKAVVASGDSLCVSWESQGHTRDRSRNNPNGGIQVSIHSNRNPSRAETDQKDHILASGIDYANFEGVKVQLPAGLEPGEYTVVWRWEWDTTSEPTFYFANCIDIEVVAPGDAVLDQWGPSGLPKGNVHYHPKCEATAPVLAGPQDTCGCTGQFETGSGCDGRSTLRPAPNDAIGRCFNSKCECCSDPGGDCTSFGSDSSSCSVSAPKNEVCPWDPKDHGGTSSDSGSSGPGAAMFAGIAAGVVFVVALVSGIVYVRVYKPEWWSGASSPHAHGGAKRGKKKKASAKAKNSSPPGDADAYKPLEDEPSSVGQA